MLMNMSRAIAAAAAGAIALGGVGLQPAVADGIPVPANPGSPEVYQNVNPSPPGGYRYGYPPPPVVSGYRNRPPVMNGYPMPPPAYFGLRAGFIASPYRRRPNLGPVNGSYAYPRYAYGAPVFIPGGPYGGYRRHW